MLLYTALYTRYIYINKAVLNDLNSVYTSGGAKGGEGGQPGHVKNLVPRQLSYSDIDHKRISWLRARLEVVNYDVINITRNSFLVNMSLNI